jgi:hypothetical protein
MHRQRHKDNNNNSTKPRGPVYHFLGEGRPEPAAAAPAPGPGPDPNPEAEAEAKAELKSVLERPPSNSSSTERRKRALMRVRLTTRAWSDVSSSGPKASKLLRRGWGRVGGE